MEELKMQNRVSFKIGEIEFAAEGSADIIERERSVFLNALLPAAVDALVRTRGVEKTAQYIEAVERPAMLMVSENEGEHESIVAVASPLVDLSRTSLSSFINGYGELSDLDFVLFAAYYEEKKNDKRSFSSDSVKQYYSDARRSKYSNNSDLLQRLVKKGYIMDDPDADKKTPKQYILTNAGIQYVEAYQQKESNGEKVKSTKPRRLRSKADSQYSSISIDELNLDKYPEVKSLKDFKEKMMMVLYIITKESKGEWFTVGDVLCLITDIFGEAAGEEQIKGVFRREKLWFKSENIDGNKKLLHRKLLNKGKEFAESLCSKVE